MADLITLEEYKVAKGLKKTDDNYAQVEHYISVASAIIQNYLGRDFINDGGTITEHFSYDYDTQSLYLDKFPITEIVSVTEIDPYGYDSTVHFPTSSSSYVADMAKGVLYKTGRYFWPQGNHGVIVTYRAGSDANGIPADIKQAAIDLTSYYVNNEHIAQRRTQGGSIENVQAKGTDFPPHIQRILDLYK
jgi:hypothetical protein